RVSWRLSTFIRFQLRRWREFRLEQAARKRAATKQNPSRSLKRDSGTPVAPSHLNVQYTHTPARPPRLLPRHLPHAQLAPPLPPPRALLHQRAHSTSPVFITYFIYYTYAVHKKSCQTF